MALHQDLCSASEGDGTQRDRPTTVSGSSSVKVRSLSTARRRSASGAVRSAEKDWARPVALRGWVARGAGTCVMIGTEELAWPSRQEDDRATDAA
jgi:hypothetical protein